MSDRILAWRNGRRHLIVAAIGLSLVSMIAGCNIIAFAAMAADEAIPRTVPARYPGLEGKSFAVVVTADRRIEADFPGVVPRVIGDVSERLAQEEKVGALGYVPPDRVLAYLYARPNWAMRSMSELAADFKVERLVFIEITEYRLNEPGNSYIWDGVAAGSVQVYESDSALPDDPAFDEIVQVTFPDGTNTGPNDVAGNVVGSELARRFVDRACWLFFEHEEMKDLKY
jgi:hypothetical protein